MGMFLKATAGVLMTVVICLYLTKQAKDISVLAVLAACCLVFVGAFSYLNPVMDFIKTLQDKGNLNTQMIGIIMKSVGIAMLSELTCQICVDSGNASLGKTLQFMANCLVLWISLPVFQSLLELVEDILVSL